jgi:hypothetical protein
MEIPVYIHNNKAVVDLYGAWPSFHDANVLTYAKPCPESQALTLTLHAWQMTNEVDSNGYFVLRNQALVSFRFTGLFEVDMDNFGADNILFGMEFFPMDDGASFRVVLDSVIDRSGSFSAKKGEVVSVIPYTPQE